MRKYFSYRVDPTKEVVSRVLFLYFLYGLGSSFESWVNPGLFGQVPVDMTSGKYLDTYTLFVNDKIQCL